MHDRVRREQDLRAAEADGALMLVEPAEAEGVSTLGALVTSAAAALDAATATIVLYDELGNPVASVPHRHRDAPRPPARPAPTGAGLSPAAEAARCELLATRRPVVGPAFIAAPLLHEGRVAGCLYVERRATDRPFAPQDVALAAGIAAGAAATITQSRILSDEQRRATRAAALRAIGRELSDELDLARLLSTLQNRLKELAGLDNCWVALWDEATDTVDMRLWVEGGRRVPEWEWTGPLPQNMTRAVLSERAPILTDDYTSECARRGIVPMGHVAERPGRAWLGLPLLARGRVVGALAVWRWDEPIPADTVATLETLTGQIVTALENARLYEETERRRREEAALGAIARDLATSLDGDALLRRIVDHARALFGTPSASIALFDPAAGFLRSISRGEGAEPNVPDVRPGEGLAGSIWTTGQTLAVDGYRDDPRFPHTPAFDEAGGATGLVSCLGTPIALGDERLGVLLVGDQTPRRFTPHDESLLGRLATQAALAVRNARLYAAEQRRAARAEALGEVGRELSAELDVDRFLTVARRHLARLVGADNCWLALWDETTGEAYYRLFVDDGVRQVDREDHLTPGQGLGWQVLAARETICVPDYGAECRSRGLGLLSLGNQRPNSAWLGVPLVTGGHLIGAMAVWRYHGPFSEPDRATLESLGGQIAAALANARLYEETERQRREEAAFNAIAGDLAASLDGETILRRIVDHARTLLGTHLGEIALFDPADNVLRATQVEGAGHGLLSETVRPEVGLVGHIWRTGQLLATVDYLADQRFPHSAALDALVRAHGYSAILGVPIALGDERLGVLLVMDQAGRRYGARDEGLLARLATQAALAVRNSRLYAQARERAARLEMLNEIGRELSAELDLDRFLNAAWRQLTRVAGVEDCWLALWDDSSAKLRLGLCVDDGVRRPEWENATRLKPGQGLVWALLDERTPLRTDDYVAECRRRGLEPHGWAPLKPERAWLGLPLLAGGRLIGAIAVWRYSRPFGVEEVAMLETLAGQMAGALENARLYHEARLLAASDPLTGLANHRHIQERLDEELARAARLDLPLTVVMLDLDNFKLFNDTWGHPTGDRILRLAAAALRDEARSSDVLGRYGGDEFLLVLPETSPAEARALLERARARFLAARPTLDGAANIPLTMSAGVAGYPADGARRYELIAAADRALYASKRGGRAAGGDAMLAVGTGFDVVEGLVLAVDAKDHYTAAHSEVVAEVALLLAGALGLPERTRTILRAAGMLHDVGKISIPDRILRKPGPLAADEWAVMRQHVEFSELIIRGVPGLHEILDPVMHHHERWDGQGYPRGLRGEEVPLLGRIMIVADAYSAMTLDRPYRRGLTVDEAIAQLRAAAGHQFDPALVALLCDTVGPDTLHALTALALAS